MTKLACMATLCLSLCATTTESHELAKGFANPPDAARPHTFWHWMNGNVTKEGITADLESMRKAGIGGVMLFVIEGQVIESMPVYIEKPVRHLTPEWFAMLRHAATECKRLELELSLMNCAGWATSGGPWVPPEQSMMRIAWSEKYVKGPGRVEGPLPQPPCDYAQYQNLVKMGFFYHESVPPEQRFYRDMAVLAYRLDPLAARTAALWPPALSCSEPEGNPAQVVDGNGATAQNLAAKGSLQFDFGEAVVVRGAEYLGKQCELQAGDDGKNWRKVADLPDPRILGYPQTLPVPATKARYFRLYFPTGGSVRDVKLSGRVVGAGPSAEIVLPRLLGRLHQSGRPPRLAHAELGRGIDPGQRRLESDQPSQGRRDLGLGCAGG